jgi:hypothetical protein
MPAAPTCFAGSLFVLLFGKMTRMMTRPVSASQVEFCYARNAYSTLVCTGSMCLADSRHTAQPQPLHHDHKLNV